MADPSNLDFTTLRKGMVLGPEHRQFRLIKPVSNSPIGQVWHANDLSTGSEDKEADKVALEIINPVLMNKTALELFKRQVTQCKQLDNPHIASTYGYFVSREGWLFIAMEPIATRSLARILLEDGYQQLSIKRIRIILSQVAKALDYAHGRKISHGDLTPWNIIIAPNTGAKLVNFAFRQPLLQQIQKQGMRVINNEYHPPEAFDHLPLAANADIYSFGCLAYQLLDGKAPFSPDMPAYEREVDTLEAPKQLTEEQWQVLKPCLSENPGDRPDNASKLVQALFPPNSKSSSETVSENASLPTQESSPPAASSSANSSQKSASLFSSGDSSTSTGSFAKALTIGVSGFIVGAAVGYLAAQYFFSSRQDVIQAKLIEVQNILAQPPSPENRVALSKTFTEFKILAEDTPLMASLENQVNSYKVRVENNKADLNRPKSIHVAPPPNMPAEQAPANNQGFVVGSVFKDEIMPDVFGPNMVVIPSGSFTMGDLSRQGDDNELPTHRVAINKAFALSQHEVTFRDYDFFALSTGRDLPDDEGWGRGDRPVINVSWNDANAYADWIRRETGLAYRLPNEAEWEYAARAGTASAYWWGNDQGLANAVCDGCGSEYDGKSTAPVGSFQANPYGLYDMNGNVYEWVSDCYNDSYEEAPNDGSSWEVGQCNLRVMRGGSWYDIPRLIRSASRYRHPADAAQNTWGFRLALDLE